MEDFKISATDSTEADNIELEVFPNKTAHNFGISYSPPYIPTNRVLFNKQNKQSHYRAKSLFISFTDFPTLSSFYKPPTTIEPSWLFINFFSDPISNASIFNKLLQFTFINFSAQYKHTFNHKSFFCLRYSQLTRSNANNFNDNPDQIAETRDNVTTLKPIRD
jgi:hypothetical protein